MGKKQENKGFICINCRAAVLPLQNGSYRNHCPFCLASIHVDIIPGDRKSTCHGLMSACKVIFNTKKGWQIVHKCHKCQNEKVNVLAGGAVQPDCLEAVIKLLQS